MPEKLGVDPFTGNLQDTQRFVHNVEIKLYYFRNFFVKEIDKVNLIIPLLKDTTKEWYQAIPLHINKDVAKRQGIKFDSKNELWTWEGFGKCVEGGFGSHSDKNLHGRNGTSCTWRPEESIVWLMNSSASQQ